jgi:hypothetical protein
MAPPAVTLEAANRVVYAALGALAVLAVHAGARAAALGLSPSLAFLTRLAQLQFVVPEPAQPGAANEPGAAEGGAAEAEGGGGGPAEAEAEAPPPPGSRGSSPLPARGDSFHSGDEELAPAGSVGSMPWTEGSQGGSSGQQNLLAPQDDPKEHQKVRPGSTLPYILPV